MPEEQTQNEEPKMHESICLACKKKVKYPIEFEGEITTKNNVKRWQIQGHCPDKNHKVRVFIKIQNKPQKTIKKTKIEKAQK